MDYYGIGYSNIRLPNSSKSYIYKYNTRINTFPEEVFLHEFLHSLERTAEELQDSSITRLRKIWIQKPELNRIKRLVSRLYE